MKIIGIHDSDDTSFPNLALMKLSAFHKQKGDQVEFFLPIMSSLYDKIYSSKVFSWTRSQEYLPKITIKGGTGYNIFNNLPDKIEHICPDYDLYNIKYSMGFLTRGCIRKCSWCIVPEKEGSIIAHADIKEFARHKDIVLMDNNVLSISHGIKQIEKIIKLGLRIDFNQGLDPRLIDSITAKLLSKVKWLSPIRLSCDTSAQIPIIQKAVTLLRWYNTKPTNFFVYVLVKDVPDALERIKFLKGLGLEPFAQPYRDQKNTKPTIQQRRFSRWVNHKAIFKTVQWENYGCFKKRKNLIKELRCFKVSK